MTSPARRHMMRVSASETARRAAAPLRNATAYEQMLVKLAADSRTLKQISSIERKADKKRELLPFYASWVSGVLTQGKGTQDDIVMTVMLWRLDADDIAGALDVARYAIPHGLTMPASKRSTACLLAEEVALSVQRLRDAGQPVELAHLLDTISLTEQADMPDVVRAKLHKMTGYVLRDADQLSEALTQLQRAMQLDRVVGVKKDIERLERALKPKPDPAAVKTTRNVSAKKAPAKNTNSPAKRGRGRPKKVAG
ncbi:terminase endonuclease subunit [Enterobacter hormaechei]|uniref:phage terminase small subunit n=1 Tax=Enterobacter hormaechei TaxID=158836 RepID=UPI0011E3FD16|nr:terminase endonuclease subunit [Enterobacter hormaechei]MDL5463459.1 terminase endonuclease subunit [Enterobacter hormaechei]TYF29082.1 terminase [Enterobacter hormaechei]